MKERDKLIEYLDTHCIDSYGELQTWQVADFILSERNKYKIDRIEVYGGLIGKPKKLIYTLKPKED